MRRDDMVVECVLDIGRLVLTSVKPAVVRVVLSEEKVGFNDIVRVANKFAGRAYRRRGRKAIEMGLL